MKAKRLDLVPQLAGGLSFGFIQAVSSGDFAAWCNGPLGLGAVQPVSAAAWPFIGPKGIALPARRVYWLLVFLLAFVCFAVAFSGKGNSLTPVLLLLMAAEGILGICYLALTIYEVHVASGAGQSALLNAKKNLA